MSPWVAAPRVGGVAQFQILAPRFSSCVALSRSLHLSELVSLSVKWDNPGVAKSQRAQQKLHPVN